MLDNTEKELVRIVLERLHWDKDVGNPGVDIDMQLWLVQKLQEVDAELTALQAKNVDSAIVTQAKMRLMKDLGMAEDRAYIFIAKLAMRKRTTKRIIAEELLTKESLVGVVDVK